MKTADDFKRVLQQEGTLQLSRKRLVQVEQRTIGALIVPSGAIVACDPAMGGEPFTERVRSGTYPVVLTIITENDDPRVALARLVFADEVPTGWKLATWPEQKRGWFSRGQPTDYGVDSAMGCFMDAQAETILRQYDGTERPEYLSNALEIDESRGPTCNWGSAMLDDATGLNVIVFSSGWGDGYYSSYWGLDAEGKVVCLVTDFGIYNDE